MPAERAAGAHPFKFERLIRATFVERPNRFLVVCDSPELGRVQALLPNPGRMWELLLPGVPMLLTPGAPATDSHRKTAFTAVAVERDGAPVFLHTHVNNAVARHLIERRRIPSLEAAECVRSEVVVGRSRFDFLLRDKVGEILLEVKSCTLFGNGVGMFPDAITARGRKHLLELDELARAGRRAAVLILVHSPSVRWFMPDYHTDLAFSQALLQVRDHVRILPVGVEWKAGLTLGRPVRLLEVPWEHVEREAQDRGAYLVLMRLPQETGIEVGGLGARRFRGGWYVYVGSAMANLTARLARHQRLRKQHHWHIDYLRAQADRFIGVPIRSSRREECAIAAAVGRILEPGMAGFGSTDCRCGSHLFYSAEDPLHRRDFHEVLQAFRLRVPGE